MFTFFHSSDRNNKNNILLDFTTFFEFECNATHWIYMQYINFKCNDFKWSHCDFCWSNCIIFGATDIVYKSLFTTFFGTRKKTHETFHILKMKANFKKEPNFGNKSMFLEEWKVITVKSRAVDCLG